MVAPRPQPTRVRNVRAARGATRERIAHQSRTRHSTIVRITGVLAGVLALLMLYVMLTSDLTGLTYAVVTAQHRRVALQEGNLRLDDRIADLRSDARLAAIAQRLGMNVPEHFAMVRVKEPAVAAQPVQFAPLSSLAGLLMPAVARTR